MEMILTAVCSFCLSVFSVALLFCLVTVFNLQTYADILMLFSRIILSTIQLFIIYLINAPFSTVENTKHKTRFQFIRSYGTLLKISASLLIGIISIIFSMINSFADNLTNFQYACINFSFFTNAILINVYYLFIKEGHILKFPDIQEKLVRRLVNSLHVLSIRDCFKFSVSLMVLLFLNSFLICSFFGYLIEFLRLSNFIQDDSFRFSVSEFMDWYFLSLLFSSSSTFIYSMIVAQKMWNIIRTMPSEFIIDLNLNEENNLFNNLKNNQDLVKKYKAWQYLYASSKYDANSRKLFYSLSRPGHHPKYWRAIVEASTQEILGLISSFEMAAERIKSAIDEAARKDLRPKTTPLDLHLNSLNSNLINSKFNQLDPHSSLLKSDPMRSKPHQPNPRINDVNPHSASLTNHHNINQVTGNSLFSYSNYPNNNSNGHHMSPILTSTPVQNNINTNDRSTQLIRRIRGEGNSDKSKNLLESENLAWEQRIELLNLIQDRLSASEKIQLYGWNFRISMKKKIQETFSNVKQRLTKIWLFVYFFEELGEYEAKLIFSNMQKYAWIIGGLSNLVCSSLTEDSYGVVVQCSLVDIVQLYFRLCSVLERWQSVYRRHQNSSIVWTNQEALLCFYLNSSLRRIVYTFRSSLLSLDFQPEIQKKLHLMIQGAV